MVSYFKEENMSKTEKENNKDRIMPSSQRWTATPSPQEALEEVIDFVDRQIDHNKRLLSIFCKKHNEDNDFSTSISIFVGRLYVLQDLKKRLPNEIKAIDHIEHIEDMAWDGAL